MSQVVSTATANKLRISASLFLVLVLVSGCKHKFTTQELQQTVVGNELKQQAVDSLKDPDSARFRHLTLYHVPLEGDRSGLAGKYSLCGELNAKNSMGGYAGYEEFTSSVFISAETGKPVEGTAGVFINSDTHPRSFAETSADECKGTAIEIPDEPPQS